MERWSLEFLLEAERDLARLDREVRRRVIDKLDWLLANFDNILPLSLTGEFKEFYKLRIGDWRAMYKVNWQTHTIFVCYIDRRDKVYRKK
ncbi:MAG: type II toxin-antitoxin system mRNA interferase toxin, RelE/StbE family [Candidatus Nealsonbacteria bacterium CG08_land_8_20_14_0_20_38_20]|uniref:Type II toxin-antitoxin system mRNA interferase toxin, RelE/StbE family n=1 Tax=Candidatus Nealsonbacteria bacterium CG08_land_8_20_14_0_20_38_20 TaxID=1974705 RepID=A0A2H0YLW6_9BACT|nr:MAG: type II toxin-antitoxin system mRNA interferase toxin, RelE/StbE family [Candidatus Nealsonbacteria bacterium CG08_land_8_20_14_0_20_38_20]